MMSPTTQKLINQNDLPDETVLSRTWISCTVVGSICMITASFNYRFPLENVTFYASIGNVSLSRPADSHMQPPPNQLAQRRTPFYPLPASTRFLLPSTTCGVVISTPFDILAPTYTRISSPLICSMYDLYRSVTSFRPHREFHKCCKTTVTSVTFLEVIVVSLRARTIFFVRRAKFVSRMRTWITSAICTRCQRSHASVLNVTVMPVNFEIIHIEISSLLLNYNKLYFYFNRYNFVNIELLRGNKFL